MAELEKADPVVRRTGLVLLVTGTTLGAALIAAARAYRTNLEGWVQQDPTTRLRVVTAVVTILTLGPLLAIAWYSWRLGRRVVIAARYPPPGMRVLQDTPIVVGIRARRRGRLLQAWAIFLSVAGLLLVGSLWLVIRSTRPKG